MGSLSIRLRADDLRSLGFASITPTYTAIGSPMSFPIRIFHLQNLTDETLMFSFDGIDDHLVLPASGFILLDITGNKTREQGFFLAEGDTIYVKELGNPTSGSVYLTTFYGSD